MASQVSSSSMEPSAAEYEDLQGTEVKGHGPDLLRMSDSGSDSVDTEGEDVNEAEADAETERDVLLSSPVRTPGEKSVPRASPKTNGDLRIHAVLHCGCKIFTCKFSTDGTLLAVGLADGSIKVYTTDGGELLHTLRDKNSSLPVTGLSFTRNSQENNILLATYASAYVMCWHVSSRQCLWWQKESRDYVKGEEEVRRQTLCLSVSPSGKQAVTGGSDSDIHLYDLNTQQRIQICRASLTKTLMDGHSSRIFAVTFHPEREWEFISGGWDNTVQFWDNRQPHAVRMLYGPHVCGEALHIDPSKNQILSGSWRKNNTVEVWDYISGNKVASVPPDPLGDSKIYTCEWLGQDHIIAAGSRANALKVIDRHSLVVKSRFFNLPNAVFNSSVCPSGKWAGLIAATTGEEVFLLVMDR